MSLQFEKLRKIFLALLYIGLNFGVYYLKAENNVNMMVFTLISAIIALVLIVLFVFCDKQKYDILKCFLPIAILCGIMFMVVTPVFRAPDEELHFYRAYEVSQGHVLSDLQNGVGGRELPSSLKAISPNDTLKFYFSDLRSKMSIPLKADKTEFIKFTTAALYSPIQYLPQAIGIFIGRNLMLNPIFIAYLGRVTNFIVWILLCFLALRNLNGMPLIFLIVLFPMQLHTATTLSPDALTNALSLLYISYIVRIAYFETSKLITKRNIVLVFVMALALSLCKIVYLPLCLLFLIVPANKFANKKDIYYKVLLVLSCAVFNIIWLWVSFRFLTNAKDGVNAIGQIAYIVTNPIRYILICLGTTANFFNMYIHSMIGANLCLFDVPIYYWVSNCYLILMLYLAVNFNSFISKKSDKYIVLLISLSVFFLINTSLYIQWTPVGISLIDGIQGRYFLPILPLLIFVFKPCEVKNIDKIVVTSAIFLTYPVLITLLIKHLH